MSGENIINEKIYNQSEVMFKNLKTFKRYKLLNPTKGGRAWLSLVVAVMAKIDVFITDESSTQLSVEDGGTHRQT